MNEKENLVKAPSGRPKRLTNGVRNRMAFINKDPNYVYRVVNDTDDNVFLREEQGYEVVKVSDHQGRNSRVESGRTVDNSLSVGGGTKAVLMRIRKEWFEEDQKAKKERVDASEAAIKKPALDGAYGKVETSFGS